MSNLLESLESRRLMSSGVTYTPITQEGGPDLTSKGTLVIKGGGGDDHISVFRSGNRITVNQTGIVTEVFHLSSVKRILVEGHGGDDRVFIDPAIGKRVTVVGGSGDGKIDGSYGDTLIGGAGDDRLYIQPSAGNSGVVIVGEDGRMVTTVVAEPALLSGGAGNDILVTSSVLDSVVGGAGVDWIVEFAALKATIEDGGAVLIEGLAELTGVEGITQTLFPSVAHAR